MRRKNHHAILAPSALQELADEALRQAQGGPPSYRMARADFFGEPLGVHVMAATAGSGRALFRVCLFVYDTGRVLFAQFASFDLGDNGARASKALRQALASQIVRAKRSELFPAYHSMKQARAIHAAIGSAGLDTRESSASPRL